MEKKKGKVKNKIKTYSLTYYDFWVSIPVPPIFPFYVFLAFLPPRIVCTYNDVHDNQFLHSLDELVLDNIVERGSIQASSFPTFTTV